MPRREPGRWSEHFDSSLGTDWATNGDGIVDNRKRLPRVRVYEFKPAQWSEGRDNAQLEALAALCSARVEVYVVRTDAPEGTFTSAKAKKVQPTYAEVARLNGYKPGSKLGWTRYEPYSEFLSWVAEHAPQPRGKRG